MLHGQAHNLWPLHLYGLGAVAGSYLSWGLLFGVISTTETLLSLGAVAASVALTSRERRFNSQDKVFAIVKTQAGGYRVGVLRGRQLKPEYVDASREEIRVGEWGQPQLGVKISVKGQAMAIPADFKVDHKLWKELL